VDLARAGIGSDREAVLEVQSDGPVTVSVRGQSLSVEAGATTLRVLGTSVTRADVQAGTLAATGGAEWPLALGLALGVLVLAARRAQAAARLPVE
jgi:hypothetical protein